ncbi:MAG: radical SAM protein [Candidatus Omnitrophica bacterium]|nr:radical SAM protein [Candidatus Omnitrophota bacterium]
MNIITVEIVLTYRCNLKCAYCELAVFEKNGPEKEMSTDQLKDTFKKLELLGTERINISGGEPLLREDISEILKDALSRSFKVSLTTNGVFVPENLKILKQLDQLILSLDGTKTTHDSLRGQGSHESALKALKLCKQNGINVMISSVVTDKTSKDDLLYLLDVCENFKIKCIIQPMICGVYIDGTWVKFNKVDELKPSYAYLNLLFNFLKKDSRSKKIIGGKYYLDKVLKWYSKKEKNIAKEFNCMAGELFLCLSPSGNIMPCSMRCANSSKKKIWESSPQELRAVNNSKVQCEGCSCYTYMALNGFSRLDLSMVFHCMNSNN